MSIIYSHKYDIAFLGLENLHPFDGKKYSKAFSLIEDQTRAYSLITIDPQKMITDKELKLVHTDRYLMKLRTISYLAGVLEFPLISTFPFYSFWDRVVLRAMRLATNGTVLATREALRTGACVNLSGGYHHAAAERGHGFCVYADVPIAIREMRRCNHIKSDDCILYIDVDAHQGDGVAQIFKNDKTIYIIDAFNRDIFPNDKEAITRIDFPIELKSGATDDQYLTALSDAIGKAFDRCMPIALAIINAGTDIVTGDPLGGMCVSPRGVLERDLLIISACRKLGVPWVMVTSGGYTQQSAGLIASTVVTSIAKGWL